MLTPSRLGIEIIDALTTHEVLDDSEAHIREAWKPLLGLEQAALSAGSEGDSEPLAQLLETLPLVAVEHDGDAHIPPYLRTTVREVVRSLIQEGQRHAAESVVSRYYGGLYFGIQQAVDIDVALRRARVMKLASGPESDTVMAAVLIACSLVVGTVGKQFAQPLRPRMKDGTPKAGLWKRVQRDRSVHFMPLLREQLLAVSQRPAAIEPSRALRCDYADFLASYDGRLSAVYADPPYTRDHYSRYYHVLETIALGDQPELSRSNLGGGASISRGVYRRDRHQSPFSIVRQAPQAFESLFARVRARGIPLILSYSPYIDGGVSRPRVMSMTQLEQIASKHYERVQRIDVNGVAHSKLTRSEMHLVPHETAEVLLVCRP
jgi:hypothetical protein